MFGALRKGSTAATRAILARSILSTRYVPNNALLTGLRTVSQSSIRSSSLNAGLAEAQEHGNLPYQNDGSAVFDAHTQGGDNGRITEFQQLADRNLVDKTVVQTITKDLGLSTMTEVQSRTLSEIIKGTDVLAQARTGTGKTLAFLIPTLQNLINQDAALLHKQALRTARSSDIRALIISPTRELAEQIAVEAKKLVQNTGVRVQTAVGGSQKRLGLREIHQNGCHILVGTPGRLIDIFSDRQNGIAAPKLSTLVLDEADRLLDQGFAEDISRLQDLLPNRNKVDRQTLLFSATVPRGVMRMVHETLKPEHKFVQTVKEGEELTHHRVPQRCIPVHSMENMMPALIELCAREAQKAKDHGSRPFKTMVFFESTAELQLAYHAFRAVQRSADFRKSQLGRVKALEIHARLTQGHRTRAANEFREADSAILFTTNVTARGMDFPNVTHVVQMFLPAQREQYIHRLGRTARGNKTGEGYLIVPKFQMRELSSHLNDLPLQRDEKHLETASLDLAQRQEDDQQVLPKQAEKIFNSLSWAYKMLDEKEFIKTHSSMVGSLWWNPDRRALVDGLDRLATLGWGMEKAPALSRMFIDKMSSSPRSRSRSNSNHYGGFGGRSSFGRDGGGNRSSRFGDRQTGRRQDNGRRSDGNRRSERSGFTPRRDSDFQRRGTRSRY